MEFRRIVMAIGVGALVGDCTAIHNGYQDVAHAVKPSRPETPQVTYDGPPLRSDAPPAARQVFNFHPAGAKSWQEPVVLDPNDGPLAADVRRTARELREFNKTQGPTVAGASTSRRCSETDVAAGRPGCVVAKPAMPKE